MTENLNQIYEDIGAIKSKLESIALKLREVELDAEKNLTREVEDLTVKIDEISKKLFGENERNDDGFVDIQRRLKFLEFGFDLLEKKRLKRRKVLKTSLIWMVRGLVMLIPAVVKVLSDNGVFNRFLGK